MITCCKYDAWHLHDLPFSYHLIFDYYDGPLEGITSCDQCMQNYYYKLLEWDECTLDSRVFAFYEISFSPKQIARDFGIEVFLRANGGLAPPQLSHDLPELPSDFTHICHSDDSFKTGFWRKVIPTDMLVDKWISYLEIEPPCE